MQQMQYYNSSSNPCFHPDNLVTMADGTFKRVDQIRKGDKVKAYTGSYNDYDKKQDKYYEVNFVIKTKTSTHYTRFVDYNGANITLNHPILIKCCSPIEIWQHPNNAVGGRHVYLPTDALYNFVLKSGHIMNINGVNCATLGHGFEDDNYIKHDYFGTDLIVQDLTNIDTNKTGYIVLESDPMLRDPVTGWINGINLSKVSKETYETKVEGYNCSIL
jgi:hypothetical protein